MVTGMSPSTAGLDLKQAILSGRSYSKACEGEERTPRQQSGMPFCKENAEETVQTLAHSSCPGQGCD